MKRIIGTVVAFVCLLTMTDIARADVLSWGMTTNEDGSGSSTDIPGQQLELVAGSSALNTLTFSWGQKGSDGTGPEGTFTRVAFGDIYVFKSAYAGTPNGLAAYAAANPTLFVAEATASQIQTNVSTGDKWWQFNAAVTLQPNTLYYFYSDSAPTTELNFTINDYTSSASNPNETRYSTRLTTNDFTATGATSDNYFELTGNSTTSSQSDGIAAPEPASFAVFCIGLAGLGSYNWLRRQRPVA